MSDGQRERIDYALPLGPAFMAALVIGFVVAPILVGHEDPPPPELPSRAQRAETQAPELAKHDEPQPADELRQIVEKARRSPDELRDAVLFYRAGHGVVRGGEGRTVLDIAQDLVSDRDPRVRSAGVALATTVVGADARNLISEGIRSDADPDVRKAALEAASLRRPQFPLERDRLARTARAAAKRDVDPTVRARAVLALPDDEEPEFLASSLRWEENAQVREALMLKLGAVGGELATRTAWRRLRDVREDPRVRAEAVRSLGGDSPQRTVAGLEDLLGREQDPAVRQAIRLRITWLSDPDRTSVK